MLDSAHAFLTPVFLKSVWAHDYEAFRGSDAETALLERLHAWSRRRVLKETSAEAAFIRLFFEETWGYEGTGVSGASDRFSLWPKFVIAGAGAGSGPGEADLALGIFSAAERPIPQVVCEFKGTGQSLDAPQNRKGNTRSPVWQCLDYLSHARRGMVGSEPIVPNWAFVSDMREFRLYWYERGDQQSVRFALCENDLLRRDGLLGDDEAARFNRFLFSRIFHRETLLTEGGRCLLLQLIYQRGADDRAIEDVFFREYRGFRDHLYTELLAHNGPSTGRFPGTNGRLVRLAQKILDRLLFIFFCEDMGQALAFPPKLLSEYLRERANMRFFDPAGTNMWQEMLSLFRAMDQGAAFMGGATLNMFNGGLFAPDAQLEALQLPNGVFCQRSQGQNEESIDAHKLTVFYLCARYNYAADLSEARTRGERRSLGLYTLGRIFEQSITELEMLEAKADDRPSINRLSKRKTDGVYYTPEWIVERVVQVTLGPCFQRMKLVCGWPDGGEGLPDADTVSRYAKMLDDFAVLDPACGSGAFLITALRALLAEHRVLFQIRRQVAGAVEPLDEPALTQRLLENCIYGIDINPSSVEIAQLALWLHTARGNRPLSSLADTIRCGNSLVTPDFYRNVQLSLDATGQERVNAFDWREAFPQVAARGGFDAVVGNPPYVKLQNLRAVQPDIATYLVDGRPALEKPFESTQTGNFDLYLPFIEQGLAMLNPGGRLGYIAPSLWSVNEYGEALRRLVATGRHLDRWLDFRSYQVFSEATIYTALQFFSKAPTEEIRVASAPRGLVAPDPWDQDDCALKWGAQNFGERWLLLTGAERELVDRLGKTCLRLEDLANTAEIFVGVQTSADAIFHLLKLGPGRYLYAAPGTSRATQREVAIEDSIMRPVVSGTEARRYTVPDPEKWILYPYSMGRRPTLIPVDEMKRQFPNAWAYLLSFESFLRGREQKHSNSGQLLRPFDDDSWYRFGRSQNIDKQHLPKLVIARLVSELACSFDEAGAYCLDNVDVGGVITSESQDPWFLAAILNAPVANFVFKRISKPFRGDYLSANKQFIAPLPIPHATVAERDEIASAARNLQRLHTERRDRIRLIERRIEALKPAAHPMQWLLSVPTQEQLRAQAPARLGRAERTAWVRAQQAASIEAALDVVARRLGPKTALAARLDNGELAMLADGVPVIDRVFVDAADGPVLLAQWQFVAATTPMSGTAPARVLIDRLRKVAVPSDRVLAQQLVTQAALLVALNREIEEAEAAMNSRIAGLYRLSEAEAALVAAG